MTLRGPVELSLKEMLDITSTDARLQEILNPMIRWDLLWCRHCGHGPTRVLHCAACQESFP